MNSKAIVLIQSIEEPLQVSFNYPLAAFLNEVPETDFFSCDSQSDQSIIYYLKQLIIERAKVYLVFDNRISLNIGIGQSLLNGFIKAENIRLLCLGDPGRLTPFIKLFNGRTFSTERDLLAYFNSN